MIRDVVNLCKHPSDTGHVSVDGNRYELLGRIAESFGEATFRVEFRRT